MKYRASGRRASLQRVRFTGKNSPPLQNGAWLLRLCTFHQINDISKLNCYARLFLFSFIVLDVVSAPRLPQKSDISPAVLRHETLLTALLTPWCERRVRSGWVGGLSDDVVSGASAPFFFFFFFPLPSLMLRFCAFNGSMPLAEKTPEATFNCLFSLSFPFLKKI